MRDDEAERIIPEIDHAVEEIWDRGTLEQRYNYLDYHFDQGGVYLRARAYLDDIGTVTLFGPFEERGSIVKVSADETAKAVMAYLSRRYGAVKRL